MSHSSHGQLFSLWPDQTIGLPDTVPSSGIRDVGQSIQPALQIILSEPPILLEKLDQLSFQGIREGFSVQTKFFPFPFEKVAHSPILDFFYFSTTVAFFLAFFLEEALRGVEGEGKSCRPLLSISHVLPLTLLTDFSLPQHASMCPSPKKGVIKLWFFHSPFLLLLFLSCCRHAGPNFRPQILTSGSCLNLCKPPFSPETQKFFWRLFGQ